MRLIHKSISVTLSLVLASCAVMLPFVYAEPIVKAVAQNGVPAAGKAPVKTVATSKIAPLPNSNAKAKVSRKPIPTLKVTTKPVAAKPTVTPRRTAAPVRTIKPSLPAVKNIVTVYYKKTNGTEPVFIHTYPASLDWTLMPGVLMQDSAYPGYVVANVNAAAWSSLEAVIFDGDWVTPGGEHFVLKPGKQTIIGNKLYAADPSMIQLITPLPVRTAQPVQTPTPQPVVTPAPTAVPTPKIVSLVTVYYKQGFKNPNIWYRPVGSDWVELPGVPMTPSEYPGYSKAVIDVGKSTGVDVAFNERGIWDDNNGFNYRIGLGVWTIQNREFPVNGYPVIAGATPTPTPAPAVTQIPSSFKTLTLYFRSDDLPQPYMHYQLYGEWTEPPGVAMKESSVYSGYHYLTIPLGNADELAGMFMDSSRKIIKRLGYDNYRFGGGTFTILNGKVLDGVPTVTFGQGSTNPAGSVNTPVPVITFTPAPVMTPTATPRNLQTVITPSVTPAPTEVPGNTDSIQVYYKTTWAMANAHYRVEGGNWTNVPGVAMRDAEVPGYKVITFNAPAGKKVEVAFNNGANGWDNNRGFNYFFSKGISTLSTGMIIPGVPVLPTTAPITVDNSKFSWDNATVYFVIPDRFYDGDPSNNHSYGREKNDRGEVYQDYKTRPGTFHGGDLKGLTMKLQDGYFSNLGVNAIWITAPYEQIHGWIGGGDPARNEGFRHYAYHGYWVLDYTEMDANMGTREELAQFIELARRQGIRIIFDVVMNHAGYATMKDMDEFKFGDLRDGWKDYYYYKPSHEAYYMTYNSFILNQDTAAWAKFWGPQWVRANLPGYPKPGGPSDDILKDLDGLSDFRTESKEEVALPPLLRTKWSPAKLAQESSELDAFFKRTSLPRTPRNYIIKWLTDWVREYGIDGFRIDTARNVELESWKALKTESVVALREWKQKNPNKKLDDLDFWMVAEAYGHGFEKSNYFFNGFDAVINFDFRKSIDNLNALEGTFAYYANKLNNDPSFNVLNYLSSHDDAMYDRNNLHYAAEALLLAPGAAQIFYGDETGRQPVQAPWTQGLRSDMNWDTMNQDLLVHWQKIGQFRNRHIAIGAGDHVKLSSNPLTYMRKYDRNGINDRVVIAQRAFGQVTLDVSAAFANGTKVRDAYTGREAVVQNGRVTIAADSKGLILLEASAN